MAHRVSYFVSSNPPPPTSGSTKYVMHDGIMVEDRYASSGRVGGTNRDVHCNRSEEVKW